MTVEKFVFLKDSTVDNSVKLKESTLKSVLKWLEINDKNYEESYNQTGDIIKKEVNKETWIVIMNEVREPLGTVISRKNTNIEFSDYLSQFQKGKYAILDFETVFAKGKRNEFIISKLVDEKEWKVVTYRIVDKKL
jgi:hypothetical protein